jgi:hypothetical protein
MELGCEKVLGSINDAVPSMIRDSEKIMPSDTAAVLCELRRDPLVEQQAARYSIPAEYNTRLLRFDSDCGRLEGPYSSFAQLL